MRKNDVDANERRFGPAARRVRISLRTTNKLLGKRNYKLIGKTGYTRKAKRCFAGAASLGGREVLVVVLGSNDLWGDLDLLVRLRSTAVRLHHQTGRMKPAGAKRSHPKQPVDEARRPPGRRRSVIGRSCCARRSHSGSRCTSLPLPRPGGLAAQQDHRRRPVPQGIGTRLQCLDRAAAQKKGQTALPRASSAISPTASSPDVWRASSAASYGSRLRSSPSAANT